MNFEYLVYAAVAFVFGKLAWGYFRNGRSLTGAMLGGRITQEVGEVALSNSAMTSQVMQVHAMEAPTGEKFVAVSVVSKAPLGASIIPYKLSQAQARELMALLERASNA